MKFNDVYESESCGERKTKGMPSDMRYDSSNFCLLSFESLCDVIEFALAQALAIIKFLSSFRIFQPGRPNTRRNWIWKKFLNITVIEVQANRISESRSIGVRSVSILAIIPSPITLFAIHHYQSTGGGKKMMNSKWRDDEKNKFASWKQIWMNMIVAKHAWNSTFPLIKFSGSTALGEADGEGGIELDSNIFQLNFPPPGLQPLLFRFVFYYWRLGMSLSEVVHNTFWLRRAGSTFFALLSIWFNAEKPFFLRSLNSDKVLK